MQVPILHGLCTLGISVRHVVGELAGGDWERVRTVKVGRCALHPRKGRGLDSHTTRLAIKPTPHKVPEVPLVRVTRLNLAHLSVHALTAPP